MSYFLISVLNVRASSFTLGEGVNLGADKPPPMMGGAVSSQVPVP